MKIATLREYNPVTLVIQAGVRYWEDATVNGQEDIDGTLIPLRNGDNWLIQIDLESGVIDNWPAGTTAYVYYKVCDAGKYWLQDIDGERVKYKGDYVPDFLDISGEGYGDYLIFNIDGTGKIEGWRTPEFDSKEWEVVP